MTGEAVADYAAEWRDSALCLEVDGDLFFPDLGALPGKVKTICAACDVTAQCLAYALAHEPDFGFYAGTSPRDRALLKRQGRA